jgi:hypothetical protein
MQLIVRFHCAPDGTTEDAASDFLSLGQSAQNPEDHGHTADRDKRLARDASGARHRIVRHAIPGKDDGGKRHPGAHVSAFSYIR